MPTSPHKYRFRIRFSNGMGDCLVLGRADNIRPYISTYVLPTTGTSRAASPTGRFRKRHSKGRADNIRPYISAYVLQMAGTSRTPSPTICFGRCCQIIRDVEDAVPYNLFRKKISKPPGGRGRPPLQYLETYSRFTLALL